MLPATTLGTVRRAHDGELERIPLLGDYMLTKPSDAARPRGERTKVLATRPLSPGAVALSEAERGFVVVRPGDSLVSLAHAKLGSGARWRELWELNRNFIPNPRTLLPGQTLRLPPQGSEPPGEGGDSLESSAEERIYVVRSMDSLSWIAKRELGAGARWREIWLLNRDRLPSPNLLHPGLALRLPPRERPQGDSSGTEPSPIPPVSRPQGDREKSPDERRILDALERWREPLERRASELDLPVWTVAALCVTEHTAPGFDRDGGLRIRFERQIFSARTGEWVSNLHRHPGDERRALASAILIDEDAAYASVAMGGAGLMGFRARSMGFQSPRCMWRELGSGEDAQIDALISLLASDRKLVTAARAGDWITLANRIRGLGSSRAGRAVELERLARVARRLSGS